MHQVVTRTRPGFFNATDDLRAYLKMGYTVAHITPFTGKSGSTEFVEYILNPPDNDGDQREEA